MLQVLSDVLGLEMELRWAWEEGKEETGYISMRRTEWEEPQNMVPRVVCIPLSREALKHLCSLCAQ